MEQNGRQANQVAVVVDVKTAVIQKNISARFRPETSLRCMAISRNSFMTQLQGKSWCMKEIFGVKSDSLERSRRAGSDASEMKLRSGQKQEECRFCNVAYGVLTGLKLAAQKSESQNFAQNRVAQRKQRRQRR